jgi:hypothetical protein
MLRIDTTKLPKEKPLEAPRGDVKPVQVRDLNKEKTQAKKAPKELGTHDMSTTQILKKLADKDLEEVYDWFKDLIDQEIDSDDD